MTNTDCKEEASQDSSIDKALLCNVSDMVNIEFVEDVAMGNYDLDRSFMECLSLKVAHKLSEILLKTSSVTNEIQKNFRLLFLKLSQLMPKKTVL